MAVRQDVADILDRAADEVAGGWTQGSLFDEDACCVRGAFIRAGRHMDSDAERQFARILLGPNARPFMLASWNDAPERTQSEVVAKLREAAAALRKARAEPSIDTGGE